MRITGLRSLTVTRRYDGSLRNTRHVWTHKDAVIVVVEAEDGRFGLGEVYCDAVSSTAQHHAGLRDWATPLVVGADARGIEAIRRRLTESAVLSGRGGAADALIAGIDIALWDLLGKFAGLPVFRLLGGYADRVPAYASGGMFGAGTTPEGLAEEMRAAVGRGLRGVKVKVAGGPLADDVARVRAIRAALGPGVPIMVDAMFLPTVPEAIRLGHALAPFELHFLEAPTAMEDVAGWCRIRDATGLMLAGPELHWSVDRMRDMLAADAVHYLQWDVTLAGGISQGRTLAGLAAAFHRTVSLHCSGSGIGLAATAHLAAGIANCDGIEFHLMHQALFDRLWRAGWSLADGTLRLPETPGLGLDLTPDELAAIVDA
ncbi:MAG: mandelate racemase/muconate lactonizing enzyme family protein [Rhodospirillales bacterium]|jgi:L-alanine-DL-glutamate epimerase-like enolase superfamily enzyme